MMPCNKSRFVPKGGRRTDLQSQKENKMSSPFGKLGDLDKMLDEVSRNVRESAAIINLVRRGLADTPDFGGIDRETASRELLKAEKLLDEVIA